MYLIVRTSLHELGMTCVKKIKTEFKNLKKLKKKIELLIFFLSFRLINLRRLFMYKKHESRNRRFNLMSLNDRKTMSYSLTLYKFLQTTKTCLYFFTEDSKNIYWNAIPIIYTSDILRYNDHGQSIGNS